MLIKEKVNQAKNILNEFDIDCWLTFARESQINGDPSLAFLVSADITWHSAFIINQKGATRAIVGQYDKITVEETGAYDNVTGFVEGIKQPLQDYLRQLNPKEIAINYSKGSEVCDGLTYGMYLTLYEFLQEIGYQDRLISAEKIISALRQRKTQTEISYMKKAIEITQNIFVQVTQFIQPGKSEKEIAAFMKQEAMKAGAELAWEETVCPAVFTGPEGAGAHYAPTDKKVAAGHILNMDFGVKFNGYCSDMQRTFYIMHKNEDTVPEDVQNGFDTIVNAIDSAKQAITPGRQGHEIDKVARDVVTNAGYDEFPHGLGHQVGRFSHDGTALLGPSWEKYANKPFEILETGMVFTLEPRLTVKDRGVATIEEMVVVTGDGAEYLSHPQKEIIVIR